MNIDEELSTAFVIETLGNDIDLCHEELCNSIDLAKSLVPHEVTEDYYGFPARQLVRAVFAYIEAVTFSVKVSSVKQCIDNEIDVLPQERCLAVDADFDLNSKGEIRDTKAKIPLSSNIRFAILLKKRAIGDSTPFDASVEWWSCLRKAIKIRDRLTHPRFPSDLTLTGDDIMDVLNARSGFEAEFSKG